MGVAFLLLPQSLQVALKVPRKGGAKEGRKEGGSFISPVCRSPFVSFVPSGSLLSILLTLFPLPHPPFGPDFSASLLFEMQTLSRIMKNLFEWHFFDKEITYSICYSSGRLRQKYAQIPESGSYPIQGFGLFPYDGVFFGRRRRLPPRWNKSASRLFL